MKLTEENQPRVSMESTGTRETMALDLARSGVSEWWAYLGRILAASFLLSAAGMIAACAPSSLAVQSGTSLDPVAKWALLPVANNSETPQAAEKLEAILATLLRIRGISDLSVYSPSDDSPTAIPLLDYTARFERALAWARGRNFRYGITGSIEEWHYKSGVEREPAVGISLRVLNINTGEVLWSATGARSGWGRDTVSGTAQELLNKMLDTTELSG